MKQVNFNDYKYNLTEDDINQIVSIIGNYCREKTLNRLRSMLTHAKSSIPTYGILNRLIKEGDTWTYCAGQSYPDEIRTVRNAILNG